MNVIENFNGIERVILIVSERCNSHCTHCKIWKRGRRDVEMDIDAVASAIGKSRRCEHLRRVNISGGEPTLYHDLCRLPTVLARIFGSKLLFSCIINGLLTDPAIHFAREAALNAQLQLFVSIDGIDNETYEAIRGVPGGLPTALQTLDELILLNKKDDLGIRLGISFTAVNQNFSQVELVYDYARSRGIDFIARIANSNEVFYRNYDHPQVLSLGLINYISDAFNRISTDQKSNMSQGQRWFFKNMLKGYKGEIPLRCFAGIHSICVRPTGEVVRCLFNGDYLGNLLETPLDDILAVLKMDIACNCWNDCETISNFEYTNKGSSLRAGW